MDSTLMATAILSLMAGIGVFLIACTIMSTNLESLSSSRLKKLFAKTSDNKLAGVGIGTVTTAAIQSSGATTVMIIGFVNAGMVSLTLAAAMIYGANIGTTVTAQIVALGMFGGDSVSMSIIFAAIAGIGAFISVFAKNDKMKKSGGILAGFGMLFVGLNLMSDSMSSFAEEPEVMDFLASIENIALLVLIGAILTAIVQSSSVVTSVAITMLVTGLIDLEQGIYITMGSNIGSCVVAILAGFTSGKNAKRTALIHLLFNVSGVIIFMTAGLVMGFWDVSYGSLFETAFPNAPQTQLAMFHTFFNVITVIIMLPLTKYLITLVTRIIPDDKEPSNDNSEPHMYYINNYLLRTPPIAIQTLKKEIINMARIAMENFRLACHMVSTKDLSEAERFRANERELDYLNENIVHYLVKLSEKELNDKDSVYLSTVYHSITDLERIGDYAENIMEYAEKLVESGDGFSDAAKAEIANVRDLIERLYEKVMQAYTEVNLELLDEAYDIEESIDVATDMMADEHIKRLANGQCNASVGAEYLSLASNAERVADHFINVGKTIREILPAYRRS